MPDEEVKDVAGGELIELPKLAVAMSLVEPPGLEVERAQMRGVGTATAGHLLSHPQEPAPDSAPAILVVHPQLGLS